MSNGLVEHPLFVAMTRPSMMAGVTLTAFVVNLIACFCFIVITKQLVIALGLFIILHVVGVMGCARDERFFDLLLGKLELSCPNKKKWGCNSYDPA